LSPWQGVIRAVPSGKKPAGIENGLYVSTRSEEIAASPILDPSEVGERHDRIWSEARRVRDRGRRNQRGLPRNAAEVSADSWRRFDDKVGGDDH
jgi:hypothetical protein